MYSFLCSAPYIQSPFSTVKPPRYLNVLVSSKHAISTSPAAVWGRWAGPADRASSGLVLLPPIRAHPNSSYVLSTLQCFSFFPKAFEHRREKVAANCMKSLVVDGFRPAESLERLQATLRTPTFCDYTCILQRQKCTHTAMNASYYAQSQQTCWRALASQCLCVWTAVLAAWCAFVHSSLVYQQRYSHNTALGTTLAKYVDVYFCVPTVSVAAFTSEIYESE